MKNLLILFLLSSISHMAVAFSFGFSDPAKNCAVFRALEMHKMNLNIKTKPNKETKSGEKLSIKAQIETDASDLYSLGLTVIFETLLNRTPELIRACLNIDNWITVGASGVDKEKLAPACRSLLKGLNEKEKQELHGLASDSSMRASANVMKLVTNYTECKTYNAAPLEWTYQTKKINCYCEALKKQDRGIIEKWNDSQKAGWHIQQQKLGGEPPTDQSCRNLIGPPTEGGEVSNRLYLEALQARQEMLYDIEDKIRETGDPHVEYFNQVYACENANENGDATKVYIPPILY